MITKDKVIVHRKGWLPKTTQTQYRIVLTLVVNGNEMTLSEIADSIKVDRQLVAHHLPIMIKKGLVVPTTDKRYMCQPVMNNIDELIKYTEPIIQKMSEGIFDEHAKSTENVIMENLMCYFALMSYDFKNKKKKKSEPN